MSIKTSLDATAPAGAQAARPASSGILGLGFSLEDVGRWLRIWQVQLGLGIGVLYLANFWLLMGRLGEAWFGEDAYYQHGPLVPIASGYMIWHFWPKLKEIPVKSTFWPLLLLAPALYLNTLIARHMPHVSALFFVAGLVLVIWALLGFKWALNTLPASAFLTLALPMWDHFIDQSTLPLQMVSATSAYYGLKLLGQEPLRDSTTMIILPKYSLNIAAACSGLKMLLATAACTAFIIIVGRLKWWASLILVAITVPLTIVFNSLRIALIGFFGNEFGAGAGEWMHDYGAYVTMGLGFYTLYKIAQWLGWKV